MHQVLSHYITLALTILSITPIRTPIFRGMSHKLGDLG